MAFQHKRVVQNGVTLIPSNYREGEIVLDFIRKRVVSKDASGLMVDFIGTDNVSFPEAPADSKLYARKDESWQEFTEFIDAPSDSSKYARVNGDWESVNEFPEAPSDNKKYGRTNNSWSEISEFEDAPSDGNKYTRKDGQWEVSDSVITSHSELSGRSDPNSHPGSAIVMNSGKTSQEEIDEIYNKFNNESSVSVMEFGAVGDGVSDDSDQLISALASGKNVFIPKDIIIKITKPIVLLNSILKIDGVIEQWHEGVGLHLVRGSQVIGGPGDAHIRRMSESFSSPLSSCMLLWNNDSSGCIENKVHNIVILNGHIDFSNPQGSVDPSKVEGTGVWLLAGDIYGMATKEAWEHTYRNRFTSVRVDGFEFAFKLQAETLSYGTRDQNGWVNGNTFDYCSSRRCKHNIYLTCPMENASGTDLEGECSGNFFTNHDVQFSTAQFIDAIYCNGRHNTFDIMLWDVKEEFFPVCNLTKRDTTKPYGYSEPSGNTIAIKGTLASPDNRGIFEISPGFNKIVSPRPTNDNILPVNPLGSGQREDQSYIGVVENFVGLMENVSLVQFQKLNSSESIIGNIVPSNIDGMFNPDQEDYCVVPIDTDTHGVNINIRFKEANNHVQLAGLSLAYKEFVSGTVDFDFYDNSDNKIGTVFSDLTRNSSINTGRLNMTNVRWFRIKIRIPQDGSVTGNVDINNIFCKAYNKRNDNYHCRKDKDEVIDGDYTLNGYSLFNGQVRLGSGATFFSRVEQMDPDSDGFVLRSSNGTRFSLVVDNSGNLSAVQLP